MIVVAGRFDCFPALERTLDVLRKRRFQATQIRAVPMQRSPRRSGARASRRGLIAWMMRGGALGDTIRRSDGMSVMDGTIAFATVGGLFGMIAGATVRWGPIATAVAGVLVMGILGYVVDSLIHWRRAEELELEVVADTTLLLIECTSEEEAELAEKILEENEADEFGREIAG